MPEQDDDQLELGYAIEDGFSYPYSPEGGLLAELIFIAGETSRPAQAVGVPAATWNKWMASARGLGGSKPSAASRKKIRRAVQIQVADTWHRIRPSRAEVTARVVWNGYENKVPHRTVNLDGLNLYSTITQFSYGNLRGMIVEFNAAVTARYGVPVYFTDVDTVTFSR